LIHFQLQIKRSSLGGFAVVSPLERRARRLLAIHSFFHWLGA
jgi:hypothetical protein